MDNPSFTDVLVDAVLKEMLLVRNSSVFAGETPSLPLTQAVAKMVERVSRRLILQPVVP